MNEIDPRVVVDVNASFLAQGGGKVPFDVETMNVDLASVTGHKKYADKGIGALYVRKGVRPIIRAMQVGRLCHCTRSTNHASRFQCAQ